MVGTRELEIIISLVTILYRPQYQVHITYSKGRCEASFHPSVLSSICPSVRYPSVPSWSIYFDEVEKEWNTDMVWQRIIYISVVNFILFLILEFLDLGTLILSLFKQLKELDWFFFFFFF